MLFTGYGLGLVDRLTPAAVVVVVAVVFACQTVASKYWLRGHRYGPAEWVLRAVTTASFPPWRRRS